MIDKTIHYIWLSGESKDFHARRCIRSWKRYMKDFRIREWHKEDFDWNAMPAYVQEALEMRKWAFVSDYLRLYILYHHGGIYLDSDVLVNGSLERFMDNRFFSAMEIWTDHPNPDEVDQEGNALTPGKVRDVCLQAAIMGSEPKHPFLRKCMNYYHQAHFSITAETIWEIPLAPDIYACIAREYGFRYINKEQHLMEGMVIYPSTLIASCPWRVYPESVAVHICAGSWCFYSLGFKIKMGIIKYCNLCRAGFILRWSLPFWRAARWLKHKLKGKATA